MSGEEAVSAGNKCSKQAAQERRHFIPSGKEAILAKGSKGSGLWNTLLAEERELRQKELER